MTKLFVGNIPFTAENSDLQAAFEKFGAVREAKIIFDRASTQSRGFGFVEFENDSDAEAALNETVTVLGRKVRIERLKEKNNGR